MSQPSHPPTGPRATIPAYGAVDLGAVAAQAQARAEAASRPASAQGAGGVVRDVTEATFQADVIDQSATVPVVIDFWATWCGPCRTLGPILERLADEYAGRFVLAKIDCDAEQRLAAAFQVQSIPSVFAVLKGQPLQMFQGALPEPQVRQVLDEVLRVAESNGVTGRVDAGPPSPEEDEAAEPPLPPLHAEALAALDKGDLDAAADAFRRALAESPADAEAAAGLAQVELLQRVRGVDAASVRQAAATRPDDVAAQTAAADLDLAGGHVEDAFARLVDLVRRTGGEDREAARLHLVELFGVVGNADPRVAAARRDLASALF